MDGRKILRWEVPPPCHFEAVHEMMMRKEAAAGIVALEDSLRKLPCVVGEALMRRREEDRSDALGR